MLARRVTSKSRKSKPMTAREADVKGRWQYWTIGQKPRAAVRMQKIAINRKKMLVSSLLPQAVSLIHPSWS